MAGMFFGEYYLPKQLFEIYKKIVVVGEELKRFKQVKGTSV